MKYDFSDAAFAAALGIGISAVAVGLHILPLPKESLCEDAAAEDEGSSSYVSSSDPIMFPTESRFAEFVLRPISPNPLRNLDDELQDPASSLRKSMNALCVSMALQPIGQTLATSTHSETSVAPAIPPSSNNHIELQQSMQENVEPNQKQSPSMSTPEERVDSLKEQIHGENVPVTTRKSYFYQTPQIGSSVVAEKLTLLAGPSSEVRHTLATLVF